MNEGEEETEALSSAQRAKVLSRIGRPLSIMSAGRVDVVLVRSMPNAKAQEIAGPKLGVDGQVEAGKVPQVLAKLQWDTNRPDFRSFRGSLTPSLRECQPATRRGRSVSTQSGHSPRTQESSEQHHRWS